MLRLKKISSPKITFLKDPKEAKKTKSKPFKDYAVYSGIAFQMIAIIGLGAFVGVRLDNYLETSKPWFTTFITLVAVLIAMYFAIRQITSHAKKKDRNP